MILILVLAILYSSAVTAVNVSYCVTNPTGKVSVDIDVVGVPGPEGPKRDQGPHVYPGDTSQCEKIRGVEQTGQISSELNNLINSTFTKCGIYSLNWRRVTYIDTTQGAACPKYLREVTNSTLNKRACGRNVTDVGCSSLNYTSEGSYTHVCGRARGYQFSSTDGLYRYAKSNSTIDNPYVDGLSITRGRPRMHIWSYVAGIRELINGRENSRYAQCPCAVPGYNDTYEGTFIDNDYYCESGFVNTTPNRIAWEDPLWDGEGCTQTKNTCCQRSGWFHKEVPPTTDDIEVRWCCNENKENEDVYTDIVEIWVS